MSVQRDLMRQARESGLALLFNITTGLLIAIIVIIQAFFLSEIVDRIFIGHQSLSDVRGMFGLLGALVLLRAALVFFNDFSARSMAVKIKTNIRRMMLEKIHRLGPINLMTENRGKLLTDLTTGIESLDAFFSQYLPQVILSALIPLAILFAVLPREPLTGIILLGTAPLIPLFMVLIGIMTEQRTRKQWQWLSRLSIKFYDSLRALELLKLINRQDQQAEVIAKTDTAYRKATMQVLQYTFLSAMVLELVATISTAIVAVEIGLRLLRGGIDFQSALFLLILTPEFYLPLRQLGVKYHASMTGFQAAGSIFQYLHTSEDKNTCTGGDPKPDHPDSSNTLFPIQFKLVSANYPQSTMASVRDISLRIEEGRHYALVGPSGAGKTTLLYLLMRFLEPSAGQITAGAKDVCYWPMTNWLSNIAWVPQHPHLVAGSIAYNITLSQSHFDEGRLVNALEKAGLMEWVASLKNQWNSPIGELSTGVSTGQAQRIALARAFYKKAPLVLLDEPTSAVDPILENFLNQSTLTLLSEKTSITIAHRLPTIYQSDEIWFVHSGQVVERGNHQQLLAEHRMYYDFYQRHHHAD